MVTRLVTTVLLLAAVLGVLPARAEPAPAAGPRVPVCAPCLAGPLGPPGAALEQLIRRAVEQDGLPASPLIGLVQEGLAKRVPPERLTVAVGQLADHLRQAQSGLAVGAPALPRTAALLLALAESRRAGVTPVELGRLITEVGRHGVARVILAAETLTDLAVRGYSTRAVLPLIQQAARRPADLASFGRVLIALELRLGAKEKAVRGLASTLARGESLDRLDPGRGPLIGPGGPDEARGRGPNREISQGHGRKVKLPPRPNPGHGNGIGRITR